MLNTEALLKNLNLRATDSRLKVLNQFQGENRALSHSDLEQALSGKFDRVTIYRTLKSFLDKGLIHKVLDDSGALKYALCSTPCTPEEHEHQHQHVHFKCEECAQTFCLDDIEIPDIHLPKGYQVLDANLLLQGICAACTH